MLVSVRACMSSSPRDLLAFGKEEGRAEKRYFIASSRQFSFLSLHPNRSILVSHSQLQVSQRAIYLGGGGTYVKEEKKASWKIGKTALGWKLYHTSQTWSDSLSGELRITIRIAYSFWFMHVGLEKGRRGEGSGRAKVFIWMYCYHVQCLTSLAPAFFHRSIHPPLPLYYNPFTSSNGHDLSHSTHDVFSQLPSPSKLFGWPLLSPYTAPQSSHALCVCREEVVLGQRLCIASFHCAIR